MTHRIKFLSLLIVLTLLQATPVIRAWQEAASDSSPEVIPVATGQAVARLLPEAIAGVKATGDIKQTGPDALAELVGEEAVVYREYLVSEAASRQYAGARADVFRAANQFAAFGLFTYVSGAGEAKAAAQEIGSGGAQLQDRIIFWKGNYFVSLTRSHKKAAPPVQLARAIASAITIEDTTAERPPLLDSLPRQANGPNSERYFLGPESLNGYVERGREMFGFAGNAEAVLAEYSSSRDLAQPGAAPLKAAPLKLLIVEYHTPQFATDALARLNQHVESLPEAERDRTIIKREGNYIVTLVNVADRESAEQLLGSISYPYRVKWLRDPSWPTNDPFRGQKAAQMLLSTFGLLGLILLTVLVGGTAFGTIVFIKRRKQQREIFSDAGGMLRLELDPLEATLLGLPPKRNED